ncbi:MAG: hypothetical protein ABII97_02025 [Patescibacteria group bacterium]
MEDSDQIKKLLNKNLAVSEESLKILKKVHRAQSIGRYLRIFKWVVIVLLALGAYYYIQPFMETFWSSVDAIKENVSSLRSTGETTKDLPPTVIDRIKNFLGETS